MLKTLVIRMNGRMEHLSQREREGPAPEAWEGEGLRCFRIGLQILSAPVL